MNTKNKPSRQALLNRLTNRLAKLQDKKMRLEKAIREEPADDRPTYDKAGSIGIEIAGSKEPKEERSWVKAWRRDLASTEKAIEEYEAIREIVKNAPAPRPLWLVNVTRKDGAWAVYKDGKRISTRFVRGRDALNHAIDQGWQVGYRGLTYNDGGYLHGVRAEAN